jgi:hypothetical protein
MRMDCSVVLCPALLPGSLFVFLDTGNLMLAMSYIIFKVSTLKDSSLHENRKALF